MTAAVRLLVVGWYVPGTGLTRVLREIVTSLASRYEVHVVGIGYTGPVQLGDWTLHPANPHGGDVFGVLSAKKLIVELAPAALLIHCDVWYFKYFSVTIDAVPDDCLVVGYVPLDGEFADRSVADPLLALDEVVAYTPWAKEQFEAAFAERGSATGRSDVPAVSAIGHGVDCSVFFPEPEVASAGFTRGSRSRIKAELFPELPDPASSFLVLNGNRHVERKRVDLSIQGFAKFSKDKPANVKLLLHGLSFLEELETTEMLRGQVRRLGMEDRILFDPLRSAGRAVPDAMLNRLYNASDVGLNTSMGEGWGLVSFEHAAAGGAQIVPEHSACGELWRGAGKLLMVGEPAVPTYSPFLMHTPDLDAIAETLERLYCHPAECEDACLAAYKTARRPEFSWSNVAKCWLQFLRIRCENWFQNP